MAKAFARTQLSPGTDAVDVGTRRAAPGSRVDDVVHTASAGTPGAASVDDVASPPLVEAHARLASVMTSESLTPIAHGPVGPATVDRDVTAELDQYAAAGRRRRGDDRTTSALALAPRSSRHPGASVATARRESRATARAPGLATGSPGPRRRARARRRSRRRSRGTPARAGRSGRRARRSPRRESVLRRGRARRSPRRPRARRRALSRESSESLRNRLQEAVDLGDPVPEASSAKGVVLLVLGGQGPAHAPDLEVEAQVHYLIPEGEV